VITPDFTRLLLEEKGCKLYYVDLFHNTLFVRTLFKIIFEKPLRLVYPDHQFSFIRSLFFYLLANHRIRKSVNKYKNADWCFFLTYDFYNKYSSMPSLLFGDWTYRILIEERMNRRPYFFEKIIINREDKAILKAEQVVSLFPACANTMKKTIQGKQINYLNQNVINTLYSGELDEHSIIEKKKQSSSVLFIGGMKYIDGAMLLKKAIDKVRIKHQNVSAHFIGITEEQLNLDSSESSYLHCYGYLDKAIEQERLMYYKLIFEAKVFCNPSAVWAGYSSTVEAMYYYTPIISSGFKDFIEEFGEHISFGMYDFALSVDSLANSLEYMLLNPNYSQMARNAHEAVSIYSWSNYVDKILAITNTNILVKTASQLGRF